ncbi:reverse transcriptase domain-containing protein [Tanacetum coccineum]
MVLELADHTISKPTDVAENVFVKVGKFYFPVDFVVLDFIADPRVPLILGRPFLRTAHALMMFTERRDHLRKADQSLTLKCSDALSISYNKSRIIEEERFLLFEEADAFIAIDDEPISPVFNTTYYDPDGDILILKALLNNDPLPHLNQGDYSPGIQKDPKVVEPQKSSLEYATSYEPKVELPEVNLRVYTPHLDRREKTSLITSKNQKQAIAWKLSDIRGIDPEFCSHKILLEDDYEPSSNIKGGLPAENPRTHQERSKKLLDAGIDYSDLLDSPMGLVPIPLCFLKKKLTEAPILIALNWDQPFEIMCDASDYAIGAVLGQRIEKHFRPIHYASKTMTKAELNYTTTEKEMLAVVYAFEKFRSYLIMNKSVVYTDHSALRILFSNKKERQSTMS